jgi:DNA polymerase-3 subunit gamma/tau
MSYVVFARKYRPQVFDEVVGQKHITTTLRNAIELNRVAHAYLFAGPRGIGKTTTARIFAKALNCERGPGPDPCNTCTPCVEITQGVNLDVLEIDAASNRGIDEVRNLRENVKFVPSKARFKVYIIDEVHMLTPEAFNALLKTLEEPPPHVKFIFATTNPHKVPQTILSRCQRFDFRRISNARIVESLKGIASKEALDVDDDALALIAKYSDGSIRDAEVMLDQLASFSQGRVHKSDVVQMLGVVDEDVLFRLTDAIASRDAHAALTMVDGLIRNGKDPIQLLTNLIEHVRNVLVAKVAKDSPDLVDSSVEKQARLRTAGAQFSVEELLYFITALSGASDLAKRTSLTRIPLEMALVKLCERSRITSLDEVLKRVKDLEAAVTRPETGTKTRPVPPVEEKYGEDRPPAGTLPSLENQARAASAEDRERSIESVANSWQAILNSLRAKKISVASYLLEGTPHSIEGDTLVVAFPKECQFHMEALAENVENRTLIEGVVRDVLKAEYRIRFMSVEGGPGVRGGARERPYDMEGADDMPPAQDARNKKIDPLIEHAIDVFDGHVVARDRTKEKP